jgi:hypothetical protein
VPHELDDIAALVADTAKPQTLPDVDAEAIAAATDGAGTMVLVAAGPAHLGVARCDSEDVGPARALSNGMVENRHGENWYGRQLQCRPHLRPQNGISLSSATVADEGDGDAEFGEERGAAVGVVRPGLMGFNRMLSTGRPLNSSCPT